MGSEGSPKSGKIGRDLPNVGHPYLYSIHSYFSRASALNKNFSQTELLDLISPFAKGSSIRVSDPIAGSPKRSTK